jgi:hypothetical protein
LVWRLNKSTRDRSPPQDTVAVRHDDNTVRATVGRALTQHAGLPPAGQYRPTHRCATVVAGARRISWRPFRRPMHGAGGGRPGPRGVAKSRPTARGAGPDDRCCRPGRRSGVIHPAPDVGGGTSSRAIRSLRRWTSRTSLWRLTTTFRRTCPAPLRSVRRGGEPRVPQRARPGWPRASSRIRAGAGTPRSPRGDGPYFRRILRRDRAVDRPRGGGAVARAHRAQRRWPAGWRPPPRSRHGRDQWPARHAGHCGLWTTVAAAACVGVGART